MTSESEHARHSDDGVPASCAALPAWVRPIFRACNAINLIFSAIAILLLLLQVLMLLVGRVEFVWLLNVVTWFVFFATVGYLALLIAKLDSPVPGWIGLVLGIGLFYGTRFAIVFLVSKAHVRIPEKNLFIPAFSDALAGLGIFLTIFAILSLVYVYGRKLYQEYFGGKSKRIRYMDTSTADAEKVSLIPKCWQMSRCRPAVRMTCPNYLDRQTCWKRRSGCFCDRELADYLVKSADRGGAQEVIDMQRNVGMIGGLQGRMKEKTRRPWRVQKTLCHSCPLFVEHQEYKYRRLSWISFPLTIGVVAGAYPFFDFGYRRGTEWLDTFLGNMVSSGKLPDFLSSKSSLANNGFEYILLAVLSLLLLSYMMSFVDTLFLKWRI